MSSSGARTCRTTAAPSSIYPWSSTFIFLCTFRFYVNTFLLMSQYGGPALLKFRLPFGTKGWSQYILKNLLYSTFPLFRTYFRKKFSIFSPSPQQLLVYYVWFTGTGIWIRLLQRVPFLFGYLQKFNYEISRGPFSIFAFFALERLLFSGLQNSWVIMLDW